VKIIHCADLHLDSSLTANFDSKQSRERKIELINTFERLLAYADDNLVDAIIIAGDLFDKANVSKTTKNVFIDGIKRLKDIDFYYLKGNHDEINFLDEMKIIPENLHLFTNQWRVYTAFSCENFDITISGLELKSYNPDLKEDRLKLDEKDFNIVSLHGELVATKAKNDAPLIALDRLKGKNIDYLALGHIHSFNEGEIDARGQYAYPGCLEARGFDEIGPKGFILLNIDEETREVTKEFIPFSKREVEEVWVDITNAFTTNDAIEIMNETIKEEELNSKNIIKFILVGEILVESDINIDLVYKHFEDDFYFIKIVNDTRFKLNYSNYIHEQSLKGEFVRLVASDNTLTNTEKMQIINIGIKALTNDLGKQDYEIN